MLLLARQTLELLLGDLEGDLHFLHLLVLAVGGAGRIAVGVHPRSANTPGRIVQVKDDTLVFGKSHSQRPSDIDTEVARVLGEGV